jgi:hypothetical protein
MHSRTLVLLAAVCATGAWGPARAADDARIPNLAPDSVTGWLKPQQFAPARVARGNERLTRPCKSLD